MMSDQPEPAATPEKTYVVREIFHSLQGEGARAGSVNVFLRFAFCNLQCSREVEGFNCDTDFSHGERMTAGQIVDAVKAADLTPGGCGWIIATGGEPTLQLDSFLCTALRCAGYNIAIETNGTHQPKVDADALDYIAVSPKPTRPCLLKFADECRIVLKNGQEPDQGQLEMASRSGRVFISPAFCAPPVSDIKGWESSMSDFHSGNVEWCIQFVKRNPGYSLSLQQHKILGLR